MTKRSGVWLCALLLLIQGAVAVGALPVLHLIHLSDGSVVRGRIVEREPGKSYVVETSEGAVARYPARQFPLFYPF
jgi:hypothetical protein